MVIDLEISNDVNTSFTQKSQSVLLNKHLFYKYYASVGLSTLFSLLGCFRMQKEINEIRQAEQVCFFT